MLATARPLLLEEVEVVAVERPSPSFVRVVLADPSLAEFGVEGRALADQRIKLIVPAPGERLEPLSTLGDAWYAEWRERAQPGRGHLRTYTVREVRGSGEGTRVVVDIVVHPATDDTPLGPGARWAEAARVGDRVGFVGPRRGAMFGGIEFEPGTAARVLLAGDETALPAIAAILAGLPASTRGAAFVEVPLSADVLDLPHPDGVPLTLLPRDGAAHGTLLGPAVLEHLAADVEVSVAQQIDPAAIAPEEIDPDLWETPVFSSSGEDVDTAGATGPHDDLYAWIAGESSVVTALRRALVRDLGLHRRQVAFMGYWRRGTAVRD